MPRANGLINNPEVLEPNEDPNSIGKSLLQFWGKKLPALDTAFAKKQKAAHNKFPLTRWGFFL